MQTPGSSFLHERNPNFHASKEVEGVVGFLRAGGESIPNEPADKISAHLGFLAHRKYVNDGILTGDQSSIDRQVEQAIILNPEDIPEGYFDLQRRIAREHGHGDISLTPQMRQEAARIISGDQRHSLKVWSEYLAGNDVYQDWFKLYAFEGVAKLGKFDKEKGEFQKRSSGTTVPFPELSRGALSQVHSWLKKAKVDGEDIIGLHGDLESENFSPEKEAKFQKALKSGRFDKLYVYALEAVNEGTITAEQKKEIEGSWKVYKQNGDPKQLHGDLQGFGLDWCTATGLETASVQLQGGDFYVYYTRGEDGKDTVPRVAIRMQEGMVAEVRGINTAQELEPEMMDITAEHLQSLPGGEEYIGKAQDMKLVTIIEKKIANDPDAGLSVDELRFIYEIDRNIYGFGYAADGYGFARDPRVSQIRSKRNVVVDMAELFDVPRYTIADARVAEYDEGTTVVVGDLDVRDWFSGSEDFLPSLKYVYGQVTGFDQAEDHVLGLQAAIRLSRFSRKVVSEEDEIGVSAQALLASAKKFDKPGQEYLLRSAMQAEELTEKLKETIGAFDRANLQPFASSMIKQGNEAGLVGLLYKLHGLNAGTAAKLIEDNRNVEGVVRNLGSFDLANPSSLLLKIFEKNDAYSERQEALHWSEWSSIDESEQPVLVSGMVLNQLPNLHDLDPEIAVWIVKDHSGNGEFQKVLANSSSFSSLDYNRIANIIIEKSRAYEVVKVMPELLPHLDDETLSRALIAEIDKSGKKDINTLWPLLPELLPRLNDQAIESFLRLGGRDGEYNTNSTRGRVNIKKLVERYRNTTRS